MFLENSADYMDQIQEGIAKNDALALARAAHSLKGSVGNFGAKRSFEAAYHLEKLGENGKLEGAEVALLELKKELAALETGLKIVAGGEKIEAS